MPSQRFRLGCPVWSCPHWRGTVYAPKAPQKRWLAEYSKTFNSVEGNSTFYGIPHADTFRRWAGETADGFKFALKFPRVISHDRQLVGAQRETDQFLEGAAILQEAGKLGPSFLQLAPGFGPTQFDRLANYLKDLPVQFPYAIEFRHHDYFKEPTISLVNTLLNELAIDRVIFDSRPLFSAPPDDEIEQVSQQRKPKSPICTEVTGRHPMLRLVGRNDLSRVQPWIDQWTDTVAHWIDTGLEPYVFTHAPDDHFAPELARMFLNTLAKKVKRLEPFHWQHEPPKQQLKLF